MQLWPEHFDLSVDFGDELGRSARDVRRVARATRPTRRPYLYVTPWTPQSGDFWNEGSFASLGFDAFAGQADQRAVALDFFAVGPGPPALETTATEGACVVADTFDPWARQVS